MSTMIVAPGTQPSWTIRSASAASRAAFSALLLRDLTVLKKNLGIFIARTLIQPFLLVFVFLYVFPQIGQGIGGGSGPAANRHLLPYWWPGSLAYQSCFRESRRWLCHSLMSSAIPKRLRTVCSHPSQYRSWQSAR